MARFPHHFLPARLPFLALTPALTVGIILSRYFPGNLALSTVIFFVAAILMGFAALRDRFPSPLLVLLCCLIGMVRYELWEDAHLRHSYLAHLPLSLDSLHGTVEEVQEGARRRAIITLKSVSKDSLTATIGGAIQVYFPYDYPVVPTPGQPLFLSDVRLEALPGPRNPGQFDYGRYLRNRGIVAQCRVRHAGQVRLETPTGRFSLESDFFYPLRMHLRDQLQTHFPKPLNGLLQGLLLGMRREIDRSVREDFQRAGVLHVLAISGLHVGFVALLIHVTLSFFPLYFKYRNLIVLLLLTGYMLLTGSAPSVVRATLMAGLVLMGINLERRAALYNHLFAAAFLILLWQPQQLWWIGFQFSFLAVLSIIYFYDKFQPLIRPLLMRIDRDSHRQRIQHWLINPFAVSLAAQLGTMPFTLYYFQQVPPAALLLNLVVVPYTALIVAAGFLFLATTLLGEGLAELLAAPISQLLEGFLAMVATAAQLNPLILPGFGGMEILLYFTIILLPFHWRAAARRKILGGAAVFLLALSATQGVLGPPAVNLLILDVGQGDSALLTTRHQKVVLIDAGPANPYYSAAERALIPALQALGRRRVHALFVSHPHADHLGGLFGLPDYCTIDSIYLPPLPSGYHWSDSLRHWLSRQNIPHRYLSAGDRVVIDEETRVYVLGPPPVLSRYRQPGGTTVNNASLVLLLKHRGHSLLFTGDAEAAAEQYLTLWKELLKSEFLKVGHHGSRTSTTEEFLGMVKPLRAALSVGEKNKFDHPAPAVLRRLSRHRAHIFRTDRQKALWWQLEEDEWHRVNWQER